MKEATAWSLQELSRAASDRPSVMRTTTRRTFGAVWQRGVCPGLACLRNYAGSFPFLLKELLKTESPPGDAAAVLSGTTCVLFGDSAQKCPILRASRPPCLWGKGSAEGKGEGLP